MGMGTFRDVNWFGVSFSVGTVYLFDDQCGNGAGRESHGKSVVPGSNKFI